MQNFKWWALGQLCVALLSQSVCARCADHLVTEPIPNLYKMVPLSVSLPIGNLRLSTSSMESCGKSKLNGLVSILEDEIGQPIAVAERYFSCDGKTMVLAHLSAVHRLTMQRLAPKFLDPAGAIPLVQGRGIPTSVLMTLVQMRLSGLRYGELRWLHALEITNAVTLLELRHRKAISDWMDSHPDQFPPPELIAAEIFTTHTGRYIQTILTQSGHRITEIKIKRGHLTFAAELLHMRRHDFDVSRARGLLSPMAKVPYKFNIVMRVEPI